MFKTTEMAGDSVFHLVSYTRLPVTLAEICYLAS